MSSYKDTLRAWLTPPEGSARTEAAQTALGAAIGKTQSAVSRYAAGARFPDAETARKIERATQGAVPYSLWQSEALTRLGIADAA
jgi:DNA-binding transcriptional regulator YdaS (Cro superfamily)